MFVKIDLFENQRAFDQLEEYGYIKVGYQREGESIIEIKSTPQIEKSKENRIFLKNAKFVEKGETFSTDNITLAINFTLFREKFQNLAKKAFPGIKDVEFIAIDNEIKISR